MTGSRREARITQRVDTSGKAKPAQAQPQWVITPGRAVDYRRLDGAITPPAEVKWGEIFGTARPGHDVEFYVGGQEYFTAVAKAIRSAKRSVFIAGWQVNYAVEMGDGTKLLQCLDQAVENGASVYVMPWLAPPGPIDTGYLHTMLAVFHLNGTRNGKPRAGRAFCLPAVAQSDMSSINAFFSHHQKLVVVDNERAFVGGIDLAYGRREDGRYSLHANGRKLEEFYNHCVPPIKTPSYTERSNCVSLLELLVVGITPYWLRPAAQFVTSPAGGRLASIMDKAKKVSGELGEISDNVKDKWSRINFLDDIGRALLNASVDVAGDGLNFTWDRLPEGARRRVEAAIGSGAQHLQDATDIVMAILTGVDVSRMPFREEVFTTVDQSVQALVGTLVTVTADNIGKRPRYKRLFEKMEQMPGADTLPDPAVQPRQPWHDVHCSIVGPSVYDLSRNFIQRWNAVAKGYRDNYGKFRKHQVVTRILNTLGVSLPTKANCPGMPAEHVPARPQPGEQANEKCWVQVCRSAPLGLLKAECASGAVQGASLAQNNCLQAMLTAIAGAQHFLYIEGQFFQSDFEGSSREPGKAWSGPAGANLSFWGLPGYERYADRLGILGKSGNDISLSEIRWRETDNVVTDPEFSAFVASVKRIISNWQTIDLVDRLGGSDNDQRKLYNPIGKAIARRIERAIDDGEPFHVYLVVPVHPEGQLDDITIMRQVDLTMNSLVHGPQSLVNAVRRALVAKELVRNGMPPAAAKQKARSMSVARLIREDESEMWVNYLTLLNLRNHAVIGGRPVTEQIYVHSKLLIADDRVAVIGSANINDRSMLGGRDSELAVIIADGESAMARLDGHHEAKVSKAVQGFRKQIWKRIFGQDAGRRAATNLLANGCLESPASSSTWKAIRETSIRNAQAYDAAFAFVPRNLPHPAVPGSVNEDNEPRTACIWPTWEYPDDYKGAGRGGTSPYRGRLKYRMPFDELFWRKASRSDDEAQQDWNVRYAPHQRPEEVAGIATEAVPAGVKGFICALPVRWTEQELNDTQFPLAVLAKNDVLPVAPEDKAYALAGKPYHPSQEKAG